MKKILSVILCLSMLMSLVPMSVFAAPDKVNGAQTAEETITAGDKADGNLLDGDYTVTYHAGTNDTVTNMPQGVTANGEYTVDNITIPKREGHYFVGWTLQPGADEVVEKVVLTSNVNLFAKWVVAGLVFDFDSESEEKLTFSNNTVEYDYANSIVTVNPTTNDPIVSYGNGSKNLFFGGDYKQIRVRIKPKIAHNAGYTVRFTSKDENGIAVVPSMGYNGDVYKAYTWKVLPETAFSTLVFDFSSMPEWSANYITGIRFDLPDGVEGLPCTGFESAIDSIAVTGAESLEFFNLSAILPEAAASVEEYNVYSIESYSEKYSVKKVEWIGDFIDGKYFKANTSYKLKVTLEATDGYVISSHPAMATVNRQLANITVDTELNRAYVEYKFAPTASLETFDMQVKTQGDVPTVIDVPGEDGGTLQLHAIINNEIANEKGVYWSIDETQSKYATVDENGLVTANLDCTALIVTATSKYNPEIKANISISITNQVPESTVTFHKGLGNNENVTNLPADTAVKGFFILPTIPPERSNYSFIGWSKDVGSEIIYKDYVTENTTYYANWGYSKGEEFTSAGGTFVADSNTVASYSISGGVLTLVPNNLNKQNGVSIKTYTTSPTASTAIFSGKLDSGLYDFIEVKTTLAPEETEVTVGIQSMNDSSAVTPANDTEKVTFYSYATSVANNPDYNLYDRVLPTKDGEYYIYRFPVSLLKNWKDTISHVNFNFAKRDEISGTYLPFDNETKFEYIRFVGRDLPAIDFINFSIPETKGVATTLDTLEVVQLGQFNITSFKWTGELIYGTYFDSNIAYKVEIKIKENSDFAPLPKSLFRVSINGTILPASEVKYNTLQKMYTITHTFPKTEDLGELHLIALNFIEDSNMRTERVFANDVIDINEFKPSISIDNYRFKGWSLSENGEIITGNISFSDSTNIYAVYEYIDEIDFSKEDHRQGNFTPINGTLNFTDDCWALITPDSNTVKSGLKFTNLELDMDSYDYIEIIYNGLYEEDGLSNKFNESLKPSLTIRDCHDNTYYPALIKTEPVIVHNTICYKYTYDITKQENADGTLSDIQPKHCLREFTLSPYTGNPSWAIASVKFIENTPIEERLVISDLASPMTWSTPDTTATANDNYEVVSVEWESGSGFNADGTFVPDAIYTATIKVKAKTGYKIVRDSAFIIVGAEKIVPDSTVLNSDGSLTIKYTYPKTTSLIPFLLKVENGEITTNAGTLQLVPEFISLSDDMDVPVKTVTYEIIENGPEGKSATISQNGIVSALYNGTVKIRVISDYNPDVSTNVTVTITNQVESYRVTFDANTNDTTVENMPEEAYVKFNYRLPSQIPTRHGFSFAGWVKNIGDTETVTKDYITQDTTYYATWVSGLNFEFNSPDESKLTSIGLSGTYDYENGVLNYTATSNDPVLFYSGSATNPLFFGGDYTHVRVRIKPGQSVNTAYTVRFTSVDENGNTVVASYSDRYDEKITLWKTLAADEYTILDFDFSGTAKWTDNYITSVRFDLPDGVASGWINGTKFALDYIRIANEEITEFDITELDVPVSKAEADFTAQTSDPLKYKVTKVEWVEPLLYDTFYNGNTEYTAKIYVKGVPGYTIASNAPSRMTVNGVEATDFEYNSATQELIIKYKFPATDPVSDTRIHTVKFIGKNADSTDAEEITRKVFAGDSLDTSTISPATCPDGTRFIGWATTSNAASSNVTAITPSADITLYAVYEKYKEFDFSNPYHFAGVSSIYGDIRFENNMAKGSPIITPLLYLNAKDIAGIEIYSDTNYPEPLKPLIYFTKASTPNVLSSYSYLPESVEAVILDDGKTYYKYTYCTSFIPEWYGIIGKLYSNSSSIRYIKFIDSLPINTPAQITIPEPSTMEMLPTIENCTINENYILQNIYWYEMSDDGHFTRYNGERAQANKVYLADISYIPAKGYKHNTTTASVNGKAPYGINVNSTDARFMYASILFNITNELVDVDVTISGKNTIGTYDKYIKLGATVKAQDESVIPLTSVTWSLRNADATTIPYATITPDGKVYPVADGKVIVRATSDYNPDFFAEHEITVAGNNSLYKVTFDKNTSDEVSDMPESVYASGEFVPANYTPVREGYFFVGWSVDEDALEPDTTFNIRTDTTLYAKWGKGYQWTFDDEATSLNKYGYSVTVDYVDGVAYYNGKGAAQIIQDNTLLPLRIETSKNNEVQIRFTTPTTTNFAMYVQSANESGASSAWNEVAKINKEVFAPDNGKFQIASFDLSDHAAWNEYPYLRQLRFDVRAAQTGSIGIDWVRILSDERDIKYNANGGLIPLYDGEVSSFKETHSVGTITLPDATRDGYILLGWAKDPVNYTKLYNDTFTLSDDTTLYAIWATEREEISGECGNGLTYTIDDNQVLIISGTGDMFEYTYGQTPWYSYSHSIEKLIVTDDVTSICDHAFADCTALDDITLGNNLTSIGDGAFENTALFNNPDNFDDGVLYISDYLIKANADITQHTIKDTTKVLADYAFEGCQNLISITLNNGITTIPRGAFFDCTILDNITIPASVTSIKDYAFAYCESIAEIEIPENVTIIGDDAFFGCTSLTKVSIGETVVYIGDNAFAGCPDIKMHGVKDSYAHTYATENGIEFISSITGDSNGDGIVNNRDAARILQYLAGWDVTIDLDAAEVNGDGIVNNRDAARILQYLAGWPVELE